MKRIDSPNRAVDLFGAGKDGFKVSVPGVTPATELTEKWFNCVQEAIVRTIEAAGLALSNGDYDQFTTALQTLLAGKVTQGGGAGQIAGVVKVGAAAGGKLKAEVAGVDQGNFAFEPWVAQQIAALVNSSPATLDTLNEIAAALGNDANFSVTMTNLLAGKEPAFVSGTRLLFQQSAAPIGWTKVITYDNAALRVVSGAAASGGSIDFTTAFVNGNTGAHVLTLAEIPAHGGHIGSSVGSGGAVEDPQASPNISSDSLGGGLGHSHTLNLDVKYVDIIIASKN